MLYSAQPFAVVCPFDPAINGDESDLPRYWQTRDMSLLKFHSGMQPMIFHVRRLPQARVMHLMQNATTEDQRNAHAFIFGVVKVENRPDGSGVIPTWIPSWVSQSAKIEALTNEELDLFAMDEIIDVGSVVYQRAFLRQGRPALFLLPESSALGLAKKAQVSLLAAQTSRPSPKLDALAEPSPPSIERTGDVPGAVTATE